MAGGRDCSVRVAILYSSSQNSLCRREVRKKCVGSCRNPLFIKSEFSLAWGTLYDDYLRPSQSFIHQVRILSYSSEAFIERDCCSRNPLFIKSEFSPWEIPLWDNPGSLASQSFIHQVRILSLMPFNSLKNNCGAKASRNPLFIKSEFSLCFCLSG